MNKAVFFDRDGTLIANVPYISDPAEVVALPEAVAWVKAAKEAGFVTIVVSNQSGVARGMYGDDDVLCVNDRIREVFAGKGAAIDAFYHCPHDPNPAPGTSCGCRKPEPGMIVKACADHGIDPSASAMIGDSACDLEAGRRAGLALSLDARFDGDKLVAFISGALRTPRRHSVFDRKSLVSALSFTDPPSPAELADWFFMEKLPDFLGARSLKKLVRAIRIAKDKGRLIGFAMGAHVVKVGLGPYIRGLMEWGFANFLAVNGAFPVHDLEIAMAGATSEDVASTLNSGDFGMARETGDAMAEIAERGSRGPGLGAAAGGYMLEKTLPHERLSVLSCAASYDVPACVFPAFGAEITAMHPCASGAALGKAAEIDFRKMTDALQRLNDGGVWVNLGSAVVLPEVFLKALNLSINLHGPISGYTTANLDMIQHYRPRVNVVERPGAEGIMITGQHEILVPLLYMILLSEDGL